YSKGTLLRTTANGDSLWMYDYFYYDTLMADGESTLRDVQPTPDGGFVAAGSVLNSASGNNPPGYTQDVWVIKVDSFGCIEPGCQLITGLESQVSNLKDALRVWPNPVASGGEVTVQVQLPEGLRNTVLRLVLVNAQGQLVREQSARTGENALDLSGLSAGLYHVHLANATTWLAGCRVIVE
ncbi:MAG: T9SS type A sorting domain-containing protein, partial [Flavobacteriales bacterium]